jgi:hypothetical protein
MGPWTFRPVVLASRGDGFRVSNAKKQLDESKHN